VKTWMFNPHTGGLKIGSSKQWEVRQRIKRHAASKYAGRYNRLDIRFRGALCYIDAFTEPELPSASLLKGTGETKKQFVERLDSVPTHLGRLRYFGGDRWSYAFYTYSHERYEPTISPTGDWFGTLEEAFDIGATYLGSD
jgi:hypothetical protein